MKYYAIRKGHHVGIIAGEWKDAEPKIKKEISGFSNPEWKGFKTKEEALAYIGETTSSTYSVNESEASEFRFCSDAVIFVDGSRNFDAPDFNGTKPNRVINKKDFFYYASYGILIFYRDGSVEMETAKIYDSAKDKSIYNVNSNNITIGTNGDISDTKYLEKEYAFKNLFLGKADAEFKDRYVLASWNVVGEVEGARRALEICFEEKNLKSVDIYYDCDQVDNATKVFEYMAGNRKAPSLQANVTYHYGQYCSGIYDGSRKILLHHVKSHEEGTNASKFNDCADILAKSETFNKPIGRAENPNLKEFNVTGFNNYLDYMDSTTNGELEIVTDDRREQAFSIVSKIVMEPSIRPKFK